MMLRRIRKYRFITPVILAIFSLSAIGVHLDVHLCKGHISAIKLISFTQNSSNTTCCPLSCESDPTDDQNCCSDEEVNASMDYDGTPIVLEITNPSPIAVAFVVSPFNIRPRAINHINPSDTGPPILGVQKRILFQSFLC